jgi:hypothetical protein
VRGSHRQRALAAAAAVLLAAGYAGVGYGAPAGPTDTTPPPETTPAPTPDPAPPAPRPKPAPKPAAKPAPKPAQVYHAPVRHSTPTPTQAPQPVYKPAPVVHHVTTKRVRHARRHKSPHRRGKPKLVVTTPKAHEQVKHASVVRVTDVSTAAVAPSGRDDVRRPIVIAAIGLAALLFLLVLAVPATAARFTPPGRVLMDHQIDLVLVGAALLLLTALLFAITGTG